MNAASNIDPPKARRAACLADRRALVVLGAMLAGCDHCGDWCVADARRSTPGRLSRVASPPICLLAAPI